MDGHGVMLQCSQPRPAFAARGVGPRWFEDAERLAKTATYCCQDILAECCLDDFLPELSPLERARWLHTELVNRRGMPLDAPLIDAMIAAVEHEQAGAMAQVRAATGDPDFTLTNPAAIIAFCRTRGLWLADLRKETVEATLRARRRHAAHRRDSQGGARGAPSGRRQEQRVEAAAYARASHERRPGARQRDLLRRPHRATHRRRDQYPKST
jgi:hypothetical protein